MFLEATYYLDYDFGYSTMYCKHKCIYHICPALTRLQKLNPYRVKIDTNIIEVAFTQNHYW